MERQFEEVARGLECCHLDDKDKCNCTECPYAVNGYNTLKCDVEMAEDTLALIHQLERQNRCLQENKESFEKRMIDLAKRMPRWISVEERLPEDEKDVAVIVQLKKGNWMYLTAFRLPFGGWWINRGSGLDYAEVTHWCPLPTFSPFSESTFIGDGG